VRKIKRKKKRKRNQTDSEYSENPVSLAEVKRKNSKQHPPPKQSHPIIWIYDTIDEICLEVSVENVSLILENSFCISAKLTT
jgi:hypothetical protein